MRGFFVPLVLAVAVLMAFIFSYVILQQKRQQDILAENDRRGEFATVAKRMKQIMDTVNLCTCNVKDFNRDAQGKIEITPTTVANFRPYFGFYKLISSGNKTVCDDANKFVDPNKDVVLDLSGGSQYASAVQTERVLIDNFQNMQDSKTDPSGKIIDRYRANFTFVARDKIALDPAKAKTRSTQKDPVVLDLYLELIGDQILGCYWPYGASSTPSTSLAPSPSPSASTTACVAVYWCGQYAGCRPNDLSCTGRGLCAEPNVEYFYNVPMLYPKPGPGYFICSGSRAGNFPANYQNEGWRNHAISNWCGFVGGDCP